MGSKLPNAQLNRYPGNTGGSSQVLQQYLNNQTQSKYDSRTTRHIHLFDEKHSNVR